MRAGSGARGALAIALAIPIGAAAGLTLLGALLLGAAPTVPPGTGLPPCGPSFAAPPTERQAILVTMPPGQDVWSIFGHNGLWIREPGRQDQVYNFGVVSLRHPGLLSRFLKGTLDFTLDTRSPASMRDYYGRQGRPIAAQTLDLPDDAFEHLVGALDHLARPEHREYRYHWTDANCATRLRDLLDDALGGALRPHHQALTQDTPRSEVLRHLAAQPGIWLAWNLVVASSADRPLTAWERMFIPDRLYGAAELATVRHPGDVERPLVASRCELLGGPHGFAPPEAPRWTPLMWLLGVLLALLVAALGLLARAPRLAPAPRRAARLTWAAVVALFGIVAGSLGAGSLWLWIASEYVGFHGSANLFVVNPLSALLLLAAVIGARATPGPRALALARGVTWGLAAVGAAGLALSPALTQPVLATFGLFLPTLLALAALHHVRRAPG